MHKPRKLHKDGAPSEKLEAALRELYKEGVRVCTGRLPAWDLIEKAAAQDTDQFDGVPASSDGETAGFDPYNHNKLSKW